MPSRVLPGFSYVLVLVLQYGTVPDSLFRVTQPQRTKTNAPTSNHKTTSTSTSTSAPGICCPVQVPCTWYYSTSIPGMKCKEHRYCSTNTGTCTWYGTVPRCRSRIYAILLPGEQGNRLTANRSDKGDSGLGIRDDMISERSQIGESA